MPVDIASLIQQLGSISNALSTLQPQQGMAANQGATGNQGSQGQSAAPPSNTTAQMAQVQNGVQQQVQPQPQAQPQGVVQPTGQPVPQGGPGSPAPAPVGGVSDLASPRGGFQGTAPTPVPTQPVTTPNGTLGAAPQSELGTPQAGWWDSFTRRLTGNNLQGEELSNWQNNMGLASVLSALGGAVAKGSPIGEMGMALNQMQRGALAGVNAKQGEQALDRFGRTMATSMGDRSKAEANQGKVAPSGSVRAGGPTWSAGNSVDYGKTLTPEDMQVVSSALADLERGRRWI